MRMTIDNKNKTIEIKDSVNLDDFNKMIEKILPIEEWKEYTLIVIKENIVEYVFNSPNDYLKPPYYTTCTTTCTTTENLIK